MWYSVDPWGFQSQESEFVFNSLDYYNTITGYFYDAATLTAFALICYHWSVVSSLISQKVCSKMYEKNLLKYAFKK